MKLNKLENKKILILGFGQEGKDNLKFLRKLFPKKVIGIADQKQFSIFPASGGIPSQRDNFPRGRRFASLRGRQFPNVKLHFGPNYLQALKNYDLIIKSPGIRLKIIKPFINKRQQVTSQTEIFFENCPGKIIGVTGTKGKGTTSSLIYKILRGAGLKAHLVGNIGKPVLSLLLKAEGRSDDVFIYELSSHQLQNLKKSPQIAVFLNVYPDHLDYYQNFDEYVKAKANITKYQTKNDYLIYNSENEIVKKIARTSKAKKLPFDLKMALEFCRRCRKIQIKGEFNLLNIIAAVRVGKLFNISEKNIKKVIEDFKPLPHRLEYIGAFRDIRFYNDAQATIPEATIAAISTLGSNLETIILGGSSKGVSFSNLAKKVLDSRIKNVILFPTTGKDIWQEILKKVKNYPKRHLPRNFLANNMPEAVRLCYENTQKGKICLLSTACASFSLFRDYREKGNLFKKYVRELGRLY